MKKQFGSNSLFSLKETGNIWNIIGKDRLAICILGGFLLVVIGMPVGKEKTQTERGITDSLLNSRAMAGNGESESSEIMETTEGTGIVTDEEKKESEIYADSLALEVENILKYMDGVGKVKVLITMENSGELVVEKDSPINRSNTIESDSEGGSRNISDMENDEETVYITDSQGNKTPYVTKKIAPLVKGVVVVAEGGGNSQVKGSIEEALSALFDIEKEKVKVVKMREDKK